MSLKKEVETAEKSLIEAQKKYNAAFEALGKADKKLRKANAAHAEAHDKYVKDRTLGFDTKLVAAARKLAINPDNFETEKELRKAIKVVEEPAEKQDEQPAEEQ